MYSRLYRGSYAFRVLHEGVDGVLVGLNPMMSKIIFLERAETCDAGSCGRSLSAGSGWRSGRSVATRSATALGTRTG